MTNTTNDKQLLKLSAHIYEPDAILRATYRFNDSCHIYIDRLDEDTFGVYFKAKNEANIPLTSIMDNFCSELIEQQIRVSTERNFANIRDALVKQAFSPID